MALKRIMPCLLYDGKGLVKTIKFKNPSYIGDPINAIKIFNEKEVDELILIDIMASREKRKPRFESIADMAGEAFMPFAYGGGVKTYDDFAKLFNLGVEKVIVNSLVQEDPAVVKKVVADYGSQALVVCVDVRKPIIGQKAPFSHAGHKISQNLSDYCNFLITELGAGELMIYSVDRDGTWEGYDFDLISDIVAKIPVPVIACGGCGSREDLKRVLYDSDAAAAAVGSMAVYSKKGMGVLISFPSRQEIIKE